MAVPQEVLARPVFTAGEQDYRWADVVAAAKQWSRWTELERRTADGAAALERLSKEIRQAEVDEAMQAFRYERSLIAADEMEAWLEQWGLRARDWTGFLRRGIARERAGGTDGSSPDETDVWAEAVCSGALSQLAHELAERVAAAEAGGARPGPVESDLAGMEAEHAAFVQRALTPESAAKALELRNADWVRLSYTALEFDHAGMASEAALLVREDGLTTTDVAGRAGVPLHERETFLEEVGPELREPLLSAPIGDLVGPLPVRNGFALVCVNQKVAPTLADPVIQDRLQAEVPKRALEREVRNRVRWHEHL
ncbi:MAG: hypothetical protein AABM30_06475 [Actinomycetota bacterium]